jgi:glycosyltransferase involved in cell wall biosynthesis
VQPFELESDQLSIARRRVGLFRPLGADALFNLVVRFVSIIREIRPVVVHTWMDYCNVLAGIAAELVGVPTLVMGGRSVAPDNFPVLFQPYMRAGYESLLQQKDLLFLNNSFAGAADYRRWLGLSEDRVKVIHNGFEFPDKVSPAERKLAKSEYGIRPNARVVGSVIRFSEEKRPRLFVDTARQLHAWDPQLRFLIFGDGPMRQEMIGYAAASGLADVLTMPGVTTNPWQSLSAMDVFLLTSRMEGLPNVLVEAQAAGVPVVCTGVGGMNETFLDGRTGYSIPEATVNALAEAVYGLLQKPKLLKQMSENAEVHARAAFGIETMLDQISRAYNEQSTRDALWIRKELAAVRSPEFQPRALRDRKAAVAEVCRP